MKRTLEIVEAKYKSLLGGSPYTVMVAVNVMSPTDDRNSVLKGIQKLVGRMDGKSVGVKGGTMKIDGVEAQKVIGVDKVTDWLAGMFT